MRSVAFLLLVIYMPLLIADQMDEWVPLGQESPNDQSLKGITYYSPGLIKRVNKVRFIAIMMTDVYENPIEVRGKTAWSMIATTLIDCDMRKGRLLKMLLKSGRMEGGNTIDERRFADSKFVSPVIGSPLDILVDKICSGV